MFVGFVVVRGVGAWAFEVLDREARSAVGSVEDVGWGRFRGAELLGTVAGLRSGDGCGGFLLESRFAGSPLGVHAVVVVEVGAGDFVFAGGRFGDGHWRLLLGSLDLLGVRWGCMLVSLSR
jgi:hypothetical protein